MITELVLKVISDGVEQAERTLEGIGSLSSSADKGVSALSDTFKLLSKNVKTSDQQYKQLEGGLKRLSIGINAAHDATNRLVNVSNRLGFEGLSTNLGKVSQFTQTIKDAGYIARDTGVFLRSMHTALPQIQSSFTSVGDAVSVFDKRLGDHIHTVSKSLSIFADLEKAALKFGKAFKGTAIGEKLGINSDHIKTVASLAKGFQESQDAAKNLEGGLGGLDESLAKNKKGNAENKEVTEGATKSVYEQGYGYYKLGDKVLHFQDQLDGLDSVLTKVTSTMAKMLGTTSKLGSVLASISSGGSVLGAAFIALKAKALPSIEAITEKLKGMKQGIDQNIDKWKSYAKGIAVVAVAAIAIYAVAAALKAVFDITKQATEKMLELAEAGQKIRNIKDSFKILGGSDEDLAAVRRSTKGVVDEMTLYQIANVGKFNKLSTENAQRIAKVAVGAATATGQSIQDAYSRLTMAIVKGEVELLDEYGIKLKALDELKKDYAKKKGKTVSELTAQDTQDLFGEAVFKAGSKQLQLGEKVSNDPIQQFNTMRKNLEDGMTESFSKIFLDSGAIKMLTDMVKQVQGAFEGLSTGSGATFIKDIVLAFQNSFSIIMEFVKQMIPTVQHLLQMFNMFAPILEAVVKVVGTLLNLFLYTLRVAMTPLVMMIKLLLQGLVEVGDMMDMDTASAERMVQSMDQFIDGVKNSANELASIGNKAKVTIPVSFELAEVGSIGWAYATLSDEALAQWQAEQQKMKDKIANTKLLQEGIRSSFTKAAEFGFNEAPILGVTVSEAMARELFTAMGATLDTVGTGQIIAAAKEFSDNATAEVLKYAENNVRGTIERELRGVLGAEDATYNALFDDLAKVKGDVVKENEVYLRMANVVEQRSEAGVERINKALTRYEELKQNPSKITFKDLEGLNLNFKQFERTLGTTFDGTKKQAKGAKLLDTSLGQLSKTIAKVELEKLDPKGLEKQWGDFYQSLDKFGLIKRDNPFAFIKVEDAALMAEMAVKITAVGEAGEVLTGGAAMAQNAMEANGDSAETAMKQVEAFSKQLDRNAVMFENLKTAMLAAGMSAEVFQAQYGAILSDQRQARENAEQALKILQAEKDKGKKGKGNKDAEGLIKRYQELYLSDFEKKVKEINDVYTKDLKTAGKNEELKSKAEEIYKTNLLRADLEKLKSYGLSIVESVKAKAATVKSIYDFYADVISERLDKFNEINKEIKAAALKNVKVNTNFGGERGLSDEEINVLGKKDALKERQSETLSVLVEGTSEYLAVKKYFAEQSLSLDLELTEAGIQAEWAYLSAKTEVYSQLFDLSQSYIEQIWKEGDETQKAVGNVAFGILSLGSTLDVFFSKMKEVNFADMSGLQAGLKTMQIFASSAGQLADKVIKSEKAKAIIKGAIQVAEAAAAFATPGGIMQGIAHSAAASLFFAAAGTSGKKAEAKAIEPKRAAALTDRDSQAGRNDRVQQIFQIFVNPITGQSVVGLVNGANQNGQGPQFTSRAIKDPNRVTGL